MVSKFSLRSREFNGTTLVSVSLLGHKLVITCICPATNHKFWGLPEITNLTGKSRDRYHSKALCHVTP